MKTKEQIELYYADLKSQASDLEGHPGVIVLHAMALALSWVLDPEEKP